MCGIVGYVGKRQAAPILLASLAALEYRGYDSAGIAVRDGDSLTEIVKAKGNIINLMEKTDQGNSLKGSCGIGHTRWATHGDASERNAHPHVSCNHTKDGEGLLNCEVIGVHNGIIENYEELKTKLERHGYVFYSDTDSEVVIKLIDYYYKKYAHTCVDALAKTMVRVRGTYALEVMFFDHPNEIWLAKNESPMVIGVEKDESFIASDTSTLLSHTRTVYDINDLEMACVKAGEVHFYDLNGDEVPKESTYISWEIDSPQKGGYEHFMMKEIHDQVEATRDTLQSILKDNHIDFSSIGLSDEALSSFDSITLVGCGSAWHAANVGQYVIEDLAKVPVRVELSSEFRYRNPVLSKNTLFVVLSQSGETIDSLAALTLAKKQGLKTLAIVNVKGSYIARVADHVLYTEAGREIALASTKAYSAQLIALYCLAIKLATLHTSLDEKYYVEQLKLIPSKIETILKDDTQIQQLASKISYLHHIFFIGRGIDYASCMEGSLKLKETSYLHSEAYAAGELKHGPMALIEEGSVVIGILTQKEIYKKTLSNMLECQARGAELVEIVSDHILLEKDGHTRIVIPEVEEHFMASLVIVPLQLLSYYVAVSKGLSVDNPRHLAKSVTVE